MEKTTLAAVAAGRFDWSDLGTWQSVFNANPKDGGGNVVTGEAALIETRNSLVNTTRHKVGLLGLSDVVVVATEDGVLVMPRAMAGEVRSVATAVAAMPQRPQGDFTRQYRPWGHFQTVARADRHQVKRIVVQPGHRLSLQVHAHRAEHWTVVEGAGEVTVGPDRKSVKVVTLREMQSIDIPRGSVHRLANRDQQPLTLIEVQTGDYLGEDDIVRLEDDYGR
jgi:mannose-1-phosphate guanylyltransferase / mannose-6-phosphate isomerase